MRRRSMLHFCYKRVSRLFCIRQIVIIIIVAAPRRYLKPYVSRWLLTISRASDCTIFLAEVVIFQINALSHLPGRGYLFAHLSISGAAWHVAFCAHGNLRWEANKTWLACCYHIIALRYKNPERNAASSSKSHFGRAASWLRSEQASGNGAFAIPIYLLQFIVGGEATIVLISILYCRAFVLAWNWPYGIDPPINNYSPLRYLASMAE